MVRSIILASVVGVMLMLVVIGALSISPVFESPAADRLLARLLNQIFPQVPLNTAPTNQSIESVMPSAELPNTGATATPQATGLQAASSPVIADTLYGLINGARRDQGRSILTVSQTLEQAAAELNASRSLAPVGDAPDEAMTIEKNGYDASSFTVLEATAASTWQVLQSWQQDPRSDLLLTSATFTEMGLSIICNAQMNGTCDVLLILATPT